MRNLATLALGSASLFFGLSVALAQPAAAPAPPSLPAQPSKFVWPAEMKNRQVLPAGFGGDRLRRLMTGYTRDLGVRCTFCHAGQEGQPLSTIDFSSDANPKKNVARAMLKLVHRLNTQDLDTIPGLSLKAQVSCYTCHRGASKPLTDAPPKPPETPAPTPAKPERG